MATLSHRSSRRDVEIALRADERIQGNIILSTKKKQSTIKKNGEPANVSWPRLDEEVPAIAQAMGAEQDEKRAYRHRVSQASDCVRNIVMGIRGVPADPRTGRMQVLLDDSSNHEELTNRWLDKTRFPVGDRQRGLVVAAVPTKGSITKFTCDVCGKVVKSNEIHGHIDGTVPVDKEVVLYEHKAISHFRFEQLGEQEKQPEDYVQQCCGYICGLQNQGLKVKRAILLIKNKNTSAYKQFGITYDRKEDTAQVIALWTGEAVYYRGVVKELIAKHIIIQRAIDDPKSPLPERPYAYDSLPCSWCRRKDKCWDSYPEEIEKRKDLALDPNSDLAKDIRTLVEARAVARKAEEVAKGLRQKVAVGLASLGIKSGDVWFDDGVAVNFGINAMRRSFLDRSLIPPDIAAEATRFSMAEVVNARVIGGKKKNGKG